MNSGDTAVPPRQSSIWLFLLMVFLVSFFYEYGLRALGNRVAAMDRAIVDHWRFFGYLVPAVLCAGLGYMFFRRVRLSAERLGFVFLTGAVSMFVGLCAWMVACPWFAECI